MKKLLILLLVFIATNTLAQSFYEITWEYDNTLYTGFLTYYSDADATVRVAFKDKKKNYKVAEYRVYGSYYKTTDQKENYYLNGQNARLVYGDDGKSGYNADNFIWAEKDQNGKFTKLYTIDDDQLEKSDYSEYFEDASIRELDPKQFTSQYLYKFFEKNETNYSKLLALSRPSKVNLGNNYSTTLHLVVIANTLDNSIGKGCEIDKGKLINEFRDIASALNIRFSSHVVSGSDFNKSNVNAAINSLAPASNDIIVFFYRGHGFRWSNQSSEWPQMSLRSSSYQEIVGLGLDDVYRSIVAKGARLNLVFGDLCNSDIGINSIDNQPSNYFQSSFYPDLNKLRRLFLTAKGNLISASARKGEVSWVNNYDGGLYTTGFFEAFFKEVGVNTGSGSWESLISNAIDNARYKSNKCRNCTLQNGIYYNGITY